MSGTYFIDESGNTGDAVNAGEAFDFGAQPVFVLACVGVDDVAACECELARLKKLHNVQAAELKSTSVKDKPRFVRDVARWLAERKLPIFIEVVDKRFFICANMVNSLLIPPVGAIDFERDMIVMKNAVAEYLYATMPLNILRTFLEACAPPSIDGTRAAFTAILGWLASRMPDDAIAAGIHKFAADSHADFETMAASAAPNARAFLPVPDAAKKGKPFWMLPNLTSFTNIYARINLHRGRDLTGVRLVHDEQLQFDAILADGKAATENFAATGLTWPMPTADYTFTSKAILSFEVSAGGAGIQLADVLAGYLMRYVQDVGVRREVLPPEHTDTFRAILALSDPPRGVGINFVLPTADVLRLGVLPNRQ